MRPRFDFFEKVIVCADSVETRKIDGRLGAVLGRVQGDGGNWYYAVHIYETSESWSLCEDELTSTGDFDSKDSFYSDDQIRVAVDESGRGNIVKER